MAILKRFSDELGFTTLIQSKRDVHLLLLTKAMRMFAYGSSTLILALYFAALGESDTRIGLFMTLTLVGDVGISLVLSMVADSLGRRRILIFGSLSMVLSGVVFGITSNYWVLLLAAIVGVISPSGNEIGPFRTVEESTLAHLTEAKTRADIFALYVVVGALGASAGSFVCGWVTQALQAGGWSEVASYRFIFWAYAVMGLSKAGMSLLLSRACEITPEPARPTQTQEQDEVEGERLLSSTNGQSRSRVQNALPPPKKSSWAQISKKSRLTLLKLCGLFAFDSLASGMIAGSLVAYYIERKFPSLPKGKLGTIIATAQFCSSLGNIFASSLARRIGLIKTMVFTHLPSAVFLALIPAPSSLALTIFFLVARASIASMDQAPRSAFLAAVVLPSERTAVMGIVNTVKTTSQSLGPLITGGLASGDRFWIAFVLAGALKASYDVSMLVMFVNTPLEGEDRRDTNADATQNNKGQEQHHEDDMELSELVDHDSDAGDSQALK